MMGYVGMGYWEGMLGMWCTGKGCAGIVFALYSRSHPAVMAQWLGCRIRSHKLASSSPATAMSSFGIGSLNHN